MALNQVNVQWVKDHPSEIDGMEVTGMTAVAVANGHLTFNVDNADPAFFSVYAHGRDGDVLCLGDFERHGEAVNWARTWMDTLNLSCAYHDFFQTVSVPERGHETTPDNVRF